MFHGAIADCCIEGRSEGSTKEKMEMLIISRFEVPGHLTVNPTLIFVNASSVMKSRAVADRM